MAHFAELDSNNIVLRVIVIDNNRLRDENGVEQEALGVAYCKSLFGESTNWVQTSYNGNFRENFAGETDVYDPQTDRFIPSPRGQAIIEEDPI